MPILVDGHNLIGRLPGLSLQDPDDEERLVRLLVSYSARAGKRITVVFDPGEASPLSRTSRHGGVEVVFAAQGTSADAIVARRVQRSRDPAEWLVVTSDLELAGQAARLGARTQSAEAFALAMGAALDGRAEATDRPLSPEEVETWLALFGSSSTPSQGTQRRRSRG